VLSPPLGTSPLKPALPLAPKQEDYFDNQNDHYQKLEDEGPALVELVNHEVVEVLSGVQLPLNQVLVVLDADLSGCHAVEPRGEHIA